MAGPEASHISVSPEALVVSQCPLAMPTVPGIVVVTTTVLSDVTLLARSTSADQDWQVCATLTLPEWADASPAVKGIARATSARAVIRTGTRRFTVPPVVADHFQVPRRWWG
jgi:hypothetical protein